MDFPKLQVTTKPRRVAEASLPKRYWKKFENWMSDPTEFAAVHASFVPNSNLVAITTSTRVDFVDINKKEVKNSYARFKDLARSCTFRPDGALYVVTDTSGLVQVVNAATRNPLRILKGHMGPVHTACFSRANNVLSGGDDRIVKVWDLASESVRVELDGHTDSIRAMCTIPSQDTSVELIATGSYDGTVKVWNLQSESLKGAPMGALLADVAVFNFNHGPRVEAVCAMPSGSMVLSAGGNVVKIWDLHSGRLVEEIAGHTQAVTGVTVSPDGAFVITTSLDGTAKVHCLQTLECLATWQIKSDGRFVAISPDGATIAMGSQRGAVIRRRRDADPDSTGLTQGRAIRVATSGGARVLTRTRSLEDPDIINIATREKKKLSRVENLLREFRYQEAVSEAVSGNNVNYVVSVFDELSRRGALEVALRGRDMDSLLILLEILAAQIGKNPDLTPTLTDALSILLKENSDLVSSAPSEEAVLTLRRVRQRLMVEIDNMNAVVETSGALDMILSLQTSSAAFSAANAVLEN